MIQALRYEPQGQRQHFDQQEPQNSQQQDRHIHLHIHLNLTFWANQGRVTHPHASGLRRIFAALLAATVMPLGIFLFAVGTAADGPPPTAWENLMWVSSCLCVVAGLALAWWAVGALLSQLWRASPRGRLSLVLPLFLLLLIPLVVAALEQLGPDFVKMLFAIPLLVVLFAHPLLTALLLGPMSREARALGEAVPPHRKLGFVVVAGVVLVLLGGLLWNLLFMLSGGNTQLIFLPAIPIALIVAMRTLLGLLRLSRLC
jgi:hypothetical protein